MPSSSSYPRGAARACEGQARGGAFFSLSNLHGTSSARFHVHAEERCRSKPRQRSCFAKQRVSDAFLQLQAASEKNGQNRADEVDHDIHSLDLVGLAAPRGTLPCVLISPERIEKQKVMRQSR